MWGGAGNKKAARGRLDEHVEGHVLYEMMMMAAIWVRIGVHSTGRAADSSIGSADSAPASSPSPARR